MKYTRIFYLALPVVLLLLAGMACDFPTPAPQAPTNTPQQETVDAGDDSASAGSFESAEQDFSASALSTPTETTPPLSLPTSTPTLCLPQVSVTTNTNCRSGPGQAYDYLGALLVGEQAQIVGQSSVPNYWIIDNPDNPGEHCWLWGQYDEVTCDPSSLPFMTPPPTPTQQATATYTPVPTYTISGAVFCDVNENGLWDSGENGYNLANVEIRSGGSTGPKIESIKTDQSGTFSFSNLSAGTYWLHAAPPDNIVCLMGNFVATRPDSLTVSVGPESSVLFGFHCQSPIEPVPPSP